MKWGSLTKQVEAYNKQHNTNLDLHSFSMMVLANPDKYIERTKKRARFYINVINKKAMKNNISNNNITIMPKKAMKGGNVSRTRITKMFGAYPWFMDIKTTTRKSQIIDGAIDRINTHYGGRIENLPDLSIFVEEIREVFGTNPFAMNKTIRDSMSSIRDFKDGEGDIGLGLYAGGNGLYASGKGCGRGCCNGMCGSGMLPHTTIIHHYGRNSMKGGDIFSDIGNAFDPNKNGVAQAFTPQAIEQAFQPITSTFQPVVQAVKNIVPDVEKIVKQRIVNPARKIATKKVGKKVASALIHQGIPAVSGVLGSMVGNTLAPETMGVAGLLGSQVGTQLGKMGAEELGKATGYGVGRKGRFVKGSKEAKDYMASLRAKKNA